MSKSNPWTTLEELIEQLLERPFFRFFGGRLEPADIAKRLGRAQDDHRVLAAGKLLAPNFYRVTLSQEDLASFESYRKTLIEELQTYLIDLADRRNLTVTSTPEIELVSDPNFRRGDVRVEAQMLDLETHASSGATMTQAFDLEELRSIATPTSGAQLVIGGRVIPLSDAFVTLGRSVDNNIILESDDVSRHHAQIKLRQGRYVLTDLNSANGTTVNGERVTEHPLRDGDLIQFAGLQARFELPSAWRQRG